METVTRLGVTAVAALVAMAVLGVASASAQTINPAAQSFDALSTNTQLSYGSFTITCDEAGASGLTADPADSTASLDPVWFGPPTGSGDCEVNVAFATVDPIASDTDPEWLLVATEADGNGDGYGNVVIPSNAGVTVTVRLFGSELCTLHVGPQTVDGVLGPSDNRAGHWDASTQTLTFDARPEITRSGSSLCGPASGTGAYTGDYIRTDNGDAITID